MGSPIVKPDLAEQLVDPLPVDLFAGDRKRQQIVSSAVSIGGIENWKMKPMCRRLSFVRSESFSFEIA